MRVLVRRYRFPAVVWVSMAVLMAFLQHLSNRVLRQSDYSFTRWQGLHQYLDGWANFDGGEYISIAEHGYFYTPGQRSSIVWFPLYPFLMRTVELLTGDMMISGVVVTALAGLSAAILYWRWLAVHGMADQPRRVAFLVLMLYPYGWFIYGVVHADALFLMLVVGACLLIEVERPVMAGLAGALATATRPNGLAVIPGLVVLGLERGGVLTVPASARGLVERFRVPIHLDRLRIRPRALGPGLSVLGVGAYMVYLGVRFGDPFAFIVNQGVYHPGGSPLLKRAFFVAWRDFGIDPLRPLTLTAQALFAAIALCSVPPVGRRFGWGYAILVAMLVAIPTLGTADFMGTGRYLIAAFPVAALLGEQLSDRRVGRWIWLTVSATAILGLNMGFSRSWYLT